MIASLFLAAALAAPAPTPTATAHPVATPTPLPVAPLPVPQPQTGVPQVVTLQQAIDIAVAKSPVLASAYANLQLTQIPVQIARSAIFPNVSATASINRSQNSRTSGSNSGGSSTPLGNAFVSRGASLNLQQLIYDGGKSIALIHQAQANALAGSQTYQRALETLAFNVSQAYFTALQAAATVQVDQEILKQAQINENLTRAQVSAGTSARVDIITAHVPTVQAQVQLTRDQGALASALGAFANSIGLDPTTLVQPAGTPSANPANLLISVLPYNQAVTRALLLRPDYLSAVDAVSAAQYNVQAQKAGYFPTITGNASVGTNSTVPGPAGYAASNSVGATLNFPLFNQGLTHAEVQQAQAQLQLADANAAQTKLTVELNVQQALVAVASNQAAVTQAQVALSSAQESLRGAQAQYRAGVTNLVTLLQAQTNYTQAETTLLNAIYSLRQAEQTYIYAIGESSINPTPSY